MQINLKALDTEKINKATEKIDRVSTLELVELINLEDKKVAFEVEKEKVKIAKAIDNIYEKIKDGGRLIYIGAGTSGRLGVLDASECPPTYGVDFELVKGIIAGGNDAMFKAKEGAEDSKEGAAIDLKNINFSKKDALVGIAASGRTPYVIGALEYAKKIGATTVSICCVNDGEISRYSEVPIEVITGAEVVTGSTRMKAGTAQKMVLNMLSTGVMIKSGKVFGNLMVDLKPTNKKLIERAKFIISECTGCAKDLAEKVFEESDKNVKLAIFMIISNLKKEEAENILDRNEGIIAKAIESLGGN